jgi:hypothetical protein
MVPDLPDIGWREPPSAAVFGGISLAHEAAAISAGAAYPSPRPITARAARVAARAITDHEWVAYFPCDCRPPLRWIEGQYLDRIALGPAGKNSPNGVAKKLCYNSVYGKMAQSIGQPK